MSDHNSAPVVFVGPTIDGSEVLEIAPFADIKAPVSRFELYDARENGKTIFLIIDGLFSHLRAISPREVIDVARDGGIILGASSMGAVRAAECWPVGVRGVGVIFRLFRRGILDSDDEVAVMTNATESFSAFSVALINVRFAVSKAFKMGLFKREQARRVVQAASSLHFSERTWPHILDLAMVRVPGAENLLKTFDLKRADAVRALGQLRAWSSSKSLQMSRARPSKGSLRPAARYPGHDRWLGRGREIVLRDLTRWLFGSGRYQKFIWPLVIAKGALSAISVPSADVPEALRLTLALEISMLVRDEERTKELVYRELEFLDELDAEVMRFYAVQYWSRAYERDVEKDFSAKLQEVREEVAIRHGFRNWAALLADVSDGRLFGAIPMAWITNAIESVVRARLAGPQASGS